MAATAVIRPRTIAELKKHLEITSRFTLCADCPQAEWEAAETDKDDNSERTARGIENFSPIVTEKTLEGLVHIACHCAAKNRYIPLPITYCQTYEQTMAQMEA